MRGSRTTLDSAYRVARKQNYSFLQTSADVRRFEKAGLLVRLHGNKDYKLKGVKHPVVRRETKLLVERLAAQYPSRCGQLVVTSATRPRSEQPRNASRSKSVHPTGMGIDLRRPRDTACNNWLKSTLWHLRQQGVIMAIVELNPPHYHVSVFKNYKQYVANRTVGYVTYTVRSGDTLLGLAIKHKTTVTRIKQMNGLRSDAIRAGQKLRLPSKP